MAKKTKKPKTETEPSAVSHQAPTDAARQPLTPEARGNDAERREPSAPADETLSTPIKAASEAPLGVTEAASEAPPAPAADKLSIEELEASIETVIDFAIKVTEVMGEAPPTSTEAANGAALYPTLYKTSWGLVATDRQLDGSHALLCACALCHAECRTPRGRPLRLDDAPTWIAATLQALCDLGALICFRGQLVHGLATYFASDEHAAAFGYDPSKAVRIGGAPISEARYDLPAELAPAYPTPAPKPEPAPVLPPAAPVKDTITLTVVEAYDPVLSVELPTSEDGPEVSFSEAEPQPNLQPSATGFIFIPDQEEVTSQPQISEQTSITPSGVEVVGAGVGIAKVTSFTFEPDPSEEPSAVSHQPSAPAPAPTPAPTPAQPWSFDPEG